MEELTQRQIGWKTRSTEGWCPTRLLIVINFVILMQLQTRDVPNPRRARRNDFTQNLMFLDRVKRSTDQSQGWEWRQLPADGDLKKTLATNQQLKVFLFITKNVCSKYSSLTGGWCLWTFWISEHRSNGLSLVRGRRPSVIERRYTEFTYIFRSVF